MHDRELHEWRARAGRTRRPPGRAMLVAGLVVVALTAVYAAVPRSSSGERPPGPVAACRPVTGLAADVDGDGCEEDVAFENGVLRAGPRRLAVGASGDQVVTGRWTCGARTLALLRPATGQVFRFDAWAVEEQPLETAALARVDGAVGLHATPNSAGQCDDLAVARSEGPPVVVWRGAVAG